MNINGKFYSWYYTDDTLGTDYVGLCLRDINKSAEALEEMNRLKDSQLKDQAEAWWDYHKPILLENILYLLKRFGLTLDDLKSKNKEEDIL